MPLKKFEPLEPKRLFPILESLIEPYGSFILKKVLVFIFKIMSISGLKRLHNASQDQKINPELNSLINNEGSDFKEDLSENLAAAGTALIIQSFRGPLLYKNNFALLSRKESSLDCPFENAASTCLGLLHLKKKIDNSDSVSEALKLPELDSTQFNNLFSMNRNPLSNNLDQLRRYKRSNYFIFFSNSVPFQIFTDFDLSKVCMEDLKEAFIRIHKETANHKTEFSINALTAVDRPIWFKAYQRLNTDTKENIEVIRSALFTMSIADDIMYETETEILSYFRAGNVNSRWYEKSFHLCLSGSGFCGYLFEHGAVDGDVAFELIDIIGKEVVEANYYRKDSTQQKQSPLEIKSKRIEIEKLPFSAQEKSTWLNLIQKERDNWSNLCFNLGVGKNFFKQKGFSPDASTQIIFSLGFFLATNRFPKGISQVVRTREFKMGRYTFSPVLSHETKSLVLNLVNSKSGLNKELFQKATIKSKEQILKIRSGEDFLSQMFALSLFQVRGKLDWIAKNAQLNSKLSAKIPILNTAFFPEVITTSFAGHKYLYTGTPVQQRDHGISMSYLIDPDDIHIDLWVNKYGNDFTLKMAESINRATKIVMELLNEE